MNEKKDDKNPNKTMSEIELRVAGRKKQRKLDDKKDEKNQQQQTRRCRRLNSERLGKKKNKEKSMR